jgi:hypothetical protein
MAKLLTRCPVCEGLLGVTELTCGQCHTRLQGVFAACRFCRLTPEHLGFVELFLRCEGNLSRVGEELGVSYPTVRNKLTAALTALGFFHNENAPNEREALAAEESELPAAKRREMLEAVSRGELSIEDAAASLRDLS